MSEHSHGFGDEGHDHEFVDDPDDFVVDPDDDSPVAVSRRRMLQALGLTAAAGAAAPLGAAAAAASTGSVGDPLGASRSVNPYDDDLVYLRGDHHIHSQYSPDGMNPVSRIVQNAAKYGLDWMVVTDHGGVAHQKLAIDKITPDIVAARAANRGVLVYQGLEWNIPGAEHATVILPPSPATVDVLKAFEGAYDGAVLAASVAAGGLGKIVRATSADGEPYAIEALRYLDEQVVSGRIPLALMFANHPARRGLDSPHEFRNWRDAAPGVAVGMEGAPGHQAAGIATAAGGIGSARGYYDFAPLVDSFASYAPSDVENPYRTYGGFDWLTAIVGGFWDSMLAEGRAWWITSTSDSHVVHNDLYTPGTQDYNATGSKGDPVAVAAPVPAGDFWPGHYSSTMVGARSKTYLDVMRGLQAGRIVAVHGRLIDALDLRVRARQDGDRRGVTLGGRTYVKRGGDIEVTAEISLARGINFNGDLPRLAKVDLIAGAVTGPVSDRDTFRAPQTRVVETFEVGAAARREGRLEISYRFRNVTGPFYLRLRGSDGSRLTSSGDPVMDVVGDANPWADLWFYANPVFVDVL
jgi:hypothetical protein